METNITFQCLAMNPFQRDQYFLAFDDGTSYWGLPKEYEDKVAELAAELKQKADIVRGSTKLLPVATETDIFPARARHSQSSIDLDEKSSGNAAPPAYTAGDNKIKIDEKEREKESRRGRFKLAPSKWCKVM
jgi:hypothetical protein